MTKKIGKLLLTSASIPLSLVSIIFKKLGCDSLHCTINQSALDSLLSRIIVTKLVKAKLKSNITCRQRDKILGQKKGLSCLSILLHICQANHSFRLSKTISVLPRPF